LDDFLDSLDFFDSSGSKKTAETGPVSPGFNLLLRLLFVLCEVFSSIESSRELFRFWAIMSESTSFMGADVLLIADEEELNGRLRIELSWDRLGLAVFNELGIKYWF